MNSYILTVTCPDQSGIIAAITNCIASNKGNILNLAQQDCVALRAVMRLGWAMPRPVNMISGRDYFPFAVLTPGT